MASFQEAQRFYAEGAYDQAIAEYTAVTRVQSKVLTVQNIEVIVGEERFPLRDAALYQIGNAHSKLYQDYTRFAAETPNDEKRVEYQALSDSTFARAVAEFRHVIETATSQVLRIRAHSRLIDLFFTAKAYPEVIAASEEMIANYPNSPQIANAYYNTGWAYYETKNYDRAIQSFEALLGAIFYRLPVRSQPLSNWRVLSGTGGLSAGYRLLPPLSGAPAHRNAHRR